MRYSVRQAESGTSFYVINEATLDAVGLPFPNRNLAVNVATALELARSRGRREGVALASERVEEVARELRRTAR